MKYIIYESVEDARIRNHAIRCGATWPKWIPQTTSDTPFQFQVITFPLYQEDGTLIYDGPEAVMCVDDDYIDNDSPLLTAREKANAYDTKGQVLAALTS